MRSFFRRVRPYLSALRLRAVMETQYRGAAFGGLVANMFFGLVLICLYDALYAGSDPSAMRSLVTYVWLQQFFFRAMFLTDSELQQQIMSGSVVYTLVRPVDQQLWWCARDLAAKVVATIMRGLPMLLLQLALPPSLRLGAPASAQAFLQFFLSITLGFLCLTQIGSICSAFTMLTLDSRGVSGMLNLAMAALSGNVIPLTLFPDRFQALMRYQPFAQALDAPIRMYLRAQSAPEFALSILVQAAWLLLLTLCARRLWKRYLTRVVVQGG